MHSRVVIIPAIVLAISACSAGGSPTTSVDEGTSPPNAAVTPAAATDTPSSEAPIDTTLAAESRSDLSKGAKEALTACGLLETLDLVSGMAELPHGTDAPKYANIWGSPPIPMDEPAWLITTKGEIGAPGRGGRFMQMATGIDPTCIVIDGVATWLFTGGSIENGEVVPPLVTNPPKLRLPPLGP